METIKEVQEYLEDARQARRVVEKATSLIDEEVYQDLHDGREIAYALANRYDVMVKSLEGGTYLVTEDPVLRLSDIDPSKVEDIMVSNLSNDDLSELDSINVENAVSEWLSDEIDHLNREIVEYDTELLEYGSYEYHLCLNANWLSDYGNVDKDKIESYLEDTVVSLVKDEKKLEIILKNSGLDFVDAENIASLLFDYVYGENYATLLDSFYDIDTKDMKKLMAYMEEFSEDLTHEGCAEFLLNTYFDK